MRKNWFKQFLWSCVEHACLTIFVVGLIKAILDFPFVAGNTIIDFKDPTGFVAFMLAPDPLALIRDIPIAWAGFASYRYLVRKRQGEARKELGL